MESFTASVLRKRRLFLDLLFPPRCPVCDGILPVGQFRPHPECALKLTAVSEPVCMKCGQPVPDTGVAYCHDCSVKRHYFQQGKARFLYTGVFKQSMYRFKYENRREYARFFAEAAAQQYGEWIRSKGIEVILPIPMYPGKKRKRGYNQAEVFAKALSEELQIPCRQTLIQRVCNTKPQKTLNHLQRRENLDGAFVISQDLSAYHNVLLVDDIYTTGSTMDATASLITGQSRARVFFLCICIGCNTR